MIGLKKGRFNVNERPKPIVVTADMKVTKLPPGQALGAGDLTKWARGRMDGRDNWEHEKDKVKFIPGSKLWREQQEGLRKYKKQKRKDRKRRLKQAKGLTR